MEAIVYLSLTENERSNKNEKLKNERILIRNKKLAFQLPERRFIELFRLNHSLANEFLDAIIPYMKKPRRSTAVDLELKVLAALRFYATGSYQRGIGQDFNIGISQTMMSRCVEEVTEVAYKYFVDKYFSFPTSNAAINANKQRFMEKTGFGGVIGAIDGTHVYIKKPFAEEWNFVNRKGFHSMNTQIICNYDLEIMSMNTKFPGATHDSAIWSTSGIRTHLLDKHARGETSWLLGDSGYPLEPWLMTPIQNPNTDAEKLYNQTHISARNCVERCIGVLKQRFRCLLRERVLCYEPSKVAKIIIVCGALHNMCIRQNVEILDTEPFRLDDTEGEREYNNTPSRMFNEGIRVRNSIILNQFT